MAAARGARLRIGLLLLLLELLDEFVERFDDAVFDLANLLIRPAQGEPAADVVHPPRDVIEGIVFELLEVAAQQPGDRRIAPRAVRFAAEQLVDGLEAFRLLQQPLPDNRLVEQERRRIGGFLGAQVVDERGGLVVEFVLCGPAADVEAAVVADQRRAALVAEAGGIGKMPRLGGGQRADQRPNVLVDQGKRLHKKRQEVGGLAGAGFGPFL